MITYTTNNSGGGWWLDDDDWKALERAGWVVDWFANDPRHNYYTGGRFLDALATSASLTGATMDEALESFRRVTGQDPDAEGCPCCGEPHSFYESPDVIKGELATEAAIAA